MTSLRRGIYSEDIRGSVFDCSIVDRFGLICPLIVESIGSFSFDLHRSQSVRPSSLVYT